MLSGGRLKLALGILLARLGHHTARCSAMWDVDTVSARTLRYYSICTFVSWGVTDKIWPGPGRKGCCYYNDCRVVGKVGITLLDDLSFPIYTLFSLFLLFLLLLRLLFV